MILGIGSDIVAIDRFDSWIRNRALIERFFSKNEIDWCLSQKNQASASLAARFAAKEAFGKALGSGLRGLSLRDIVVARETGGKPILQLGGSAMSMLKQRLLGSDDEWQIHLSLSHDGGSALAFVVIEIITKE